MTVAIVKLSRSHSPINRINKMEDVCNSSELFTSLLVQTAVYLLGVAAQRARVAVLHVAAQMDAQPAVTPQQLRLLRAARLRAGQVHAAQLAPPHLKIHHSHYTTCTPMFLIKADRHFNQ